MNASAKSLNFHWQAMLLALAMALSGICGSTRAAERPAFTQQQLEQTLAPIALYPDPLLSQILMASTYPLEVVEAARWSRSHENLVGEDAVRRAVNESWDPSVKSLLAFPQVLRRMDENLQWLQDLGDAFLGQEPQVMDTVQELRRRAHAAGNLRSDERQQIVASGPTLAIVPVYPQIIYVPYYDPRYVYGPWWWPDFTPVYWQPFPGYYARPGWTAGFIWGPSINISFGYFFGTFDWPRRHVTVVRYNYYYTAPVTRTVTVLRPEGSPRRWSHDPVHRRGVAYRGAETRQRFSSDRTGADEVKRLNADAQRSTTQSSQARSGSSRNSDSSGDPRRLAAPQTKDASGAASQRATVPKTQAGDSQREERRDHAKGIDRREKNESVESRQAAPAAITRAPRSESRAPMPVSTDSAPRPTAVDTGKAPRGSAAVRTESHKEDERQKGQPGRPESRKDDERQKAQERKSEARQTSHKDVSAAAETGQRAERAQR